MIITVWLRLLMIIQYGKCDPLDDFKDNPKRVKLKI